MRKPYIIVCKVCGISKLTQENLKYCSRQCYTLDRNSVPKGSARWYKNRRGYIIGYAYVDGKRRWLRQHRFVMENILGRPLESWEVVHHIDENRSNNSPDNLVVMPDREHRILHWKERRKKLNEG